MRAGLCLVALFAALITPLALSGGARAEGKPVYDGELTVEMQGIVGEACFGDRYEKDEDINEGNRISEEEILRLINPPSS
ncbi:MAG: hypothetical protein IH994_06405 [Proteobacteria bacterium]|nr:hypothetical protein [Pseudomonadota bacterium]